MNTKRRIEKEKEIIEVMIRLYCRRKLHAEELPQQYAELLAYARRRLDSCRFGDDKTACRRCPVHCYVKEKREMMRQIMRWCGPRMILYHPIITLKHYLQR